jgi:hypothetical protein
MMAEMSIWAEKSRYRVKPAMTTKIGTPISRRKMKRITISKEVI